MSCPRCSRPVTGWMLDKLAGVCLQCLCGFALEEDRDAAPEESSDGASPLAPGTRFQGFDVIALVGRGGMGFVYKARQPDLERMVALKILSPELARDPEFTQRFNSEAKALARLNDPNIVQVFGFGRHEELYYLAMEYVEGVSLRDLLRERRPDSDEACRILSQICLALSYAHSQGVVHRDIKPENILIDAQGRVKIADFGLAKMAGKNGPGGSATRTDVVMGTPTYMAPEQHENLRGVDHRADLYSLGVVLYEMLTGAVPHGPYQVPSRMASTDRRLDPIVLKALERTPERRYQTALHLKSDLEAVSGPGRKTSRAGSVAAVAVVVGMPLLFWFWPWKSVRTPEVPPPAVEVKPQPPPPGTVGNWRWANQTAGSGTEGDELVFVPSGNNLLVEAVPAGSRLEKQFLLQFEVKYQMEGAQQPWLYLIFEASPASGHERNAMIFFPEATHTITFASQVPGKGWGLREHEPIPPAGYGVDRWHLWEVSWDDALRRLKARVNGTEVFTRRLSIKDTLDGIWHFGLGGSCKELRIRKVRILNSP